MKTISTLFNQPSIATLLLIGLSITATTGSVAAETCNYFVDSVAGNDENDGLSSSTPWQTFVNINNGSFSQGSVICLKRGSTWREQMTIPNSGQPGSPITVTAYPLGDTSSPNPNILWDRNLLKNGGFERFVGTIGDGVSDTFESWNVYNSDGVNFVGAVSESQSGNVAVRITRGPFPNSSPYIRYERDGFIPDTQYYFELRGSLQAGTPDNVRVTIQDLTNSLYLQDDGSWTSSYNILESLSPASSNWETKSLTFTMPAGASNSRLRFLILQSGENATVTIDNLYLGQGTDRPYDAVELAYEQKNGILVDSKDHIIIDSIDVTGPHPDPHGIRSEPLIHVQGTSQDVTVMNLEISRSSVVGIRSHQTTSDVHYHTLDSHSNQNTGIYLNSQGGSVINCQSHDNGLLPDDTGDRGGIGVFAGGGIDIIGNTVFRNARNDRGADHEISVVNAVAPVNIINNYVYNARQGAIQTRDIEFNVGDASYQGGNVIAYNIIDGYATTSADVANPGGYAAIRIGHSAGGSPNVKIYNNVIANGGPPIGFDPHDSAGIWIEHQYSRNTIVKNNILLNNESYDIRVEQSAVEEGGIPIQQTFDNNIYYRDSSPYLWNWASEDVFSLLSWQAASQGDTSSDVIDPLFVNSDTGDFHLQPGSWAIDQGADVGFTSDHEGNPIIGLPDIGAYEMIDTDGDGVTDDVDNCLTDPNPNQTDSDGDTIGNVCDPVQDVLLSIAAEDGYILESSEDSNIGGEANSTGSGNKPLRIGDASKDRQFKSIVSFDTSGIPAGSDIQAASLQLTRGQTKGDNEAFATFGTAWVDLSSDGFSGSSALQLSDFEAAATVEKTGRLVDGSVAVMDMNSPGRAEIASASKIQLRLAFDIDDNDDNSSDYTGYYSSDVATSDRHPRLIVDYTLPD